MHSARGPAGPGRPARYGYAIPIAALLSFRLGGSDGVSVEAAKWGRALTSIGFTTVTVAGAGPVDRLVPGLSIGVDEPPAWSEVEAAVADADLVVVENLCSLPLNPGAARVVARVLEGRPALLHHHDLPWQRPQFIGHPPPPQDPRWSHVTINDLSRCQLADRGIVATTIYNSFAVGPTDGSGGTGEVMTPAGRGEGGDRLRRALGIGQRDRLVLQPTRAIPRKNIAGGIALSTALGATYWLLGPAEDGYGPELEALVDRAGCPVVLGAPEDGVDVHDVYQACDVVALPSTWEGFGNPTIESVVHRRPLAIGPYPVADELAAFGFHWFPLAEVARLAAWLDHPDPSLLDHNLAVASSHFSIEDLPARIASALPDL